MLIRSVAIRGRWAVLEQGLPHTISGQLKGESGDFISPIKLHLLLRIDPVAIRALFSCLRGRVGNQDRLDLGGEQQSQVKSVADC